MRIIQILESLSYGDAIGNDELALKRIIAEKGYETEIYARGMGKGLPIGSGRLMAEIPSLKKNDIVIFHESIATELNTWIRSQRCRKVMIYHNITPPPVFCAV